MKLVRSTVVVALATAWLLSLSVKDIAVSFVNEMRVMQGGDGEPVSIAVAIASIAAGVGIIGFTGVLIAVLKVG